MSSTFILPITQQPILLDKNGRYDSFFHTIVLEESEHWTGPVIETIFYEGNYLNTYRSYSGLRHFPISDLQNN
jgi:hypothetical protein